MGYYYYPSPSNSSLTIVYLEGGGWCYSQASCAGRPSSLTSSKGWAPTASFAGLMSPQEPRLAAANRVFLRYCSSDGWLGSNTAPVFPGFAMMGRAYLAAVLEDLVATQGLGAAPATELLLTGCSAGARGALFNADFFFARAAALLPRTRLQPAVLFDSHFWMDVAPLSPSAVPFRTQVQDVFALVGAGAPGYLNPACTAAFPAEPWRCMFGEFATNYTQQPYFAYVFQFDSFQLGEDEGVKTPTTPAQIAYANTFRGELRAAAEAAIIRPARAGTAAMLPACFHHCNTGGASFSTAATNGVTLEAALAEWLFNLPAKGQFIEEQCTGFACGKGCPA